LAEFRVSADALPVGVWPFVFPAARTLPHLTEFRASFLHGCNDPAMPRAWGAADVARLVNCCPNLCNLDLAMQHGAHVSELHKLSALKVLEVNFGPTDGSTLPATMHGLVALTQLEDLRLAFHCCSMGMGSLLPLTRLTSLNWFGFTCTAYVDAEDADSDDGMQVFLYQVSQLA
jgi:hypothetical protein